MDHLFWMINSTIDRETKKSLAATILARFMHKCHKRILRMSFHHSLFYFHLFVLQFTFRIFNQENLFRNCYYLYRIIYRISYAKLYFYILAISLNLILVWFHNSLKKLYLWTITTHYLFYLDLYLWLFNKYSFYLFF